MDEKAKAILIMCINPSEHKQIKKCITSSEISEKDICRSEVPSHKALLLKSFIQHKMADSSAIVSSPDHLKNSSTF